MKRIDTPTAAPDENGEGKAGFSDAIPTRLSADWFNQVQEEIAEVIESTGTDLDPDDSGQMNAAIDAKINQGLEKLKGVAGIKEPDGVFYTLEVSDAGGLVEMDHVITNYVAVPANANQPFGLGSAVTIIQTGAGQTVIEAESGVEICCPDTLSLRTQYSAVQLIYVGNDVWRLFGDTGELEVIES